MVRNRFLIFTILALSLTLPSLALDLTKAVVLAPAGVRGPYKKAVDMLIEEVEKRSQIRLPYRPDAPAAMPLIQILLQGGVTSQIIQEGYTIEIKNIRGRPGVSLVGTDDRGVLFGVGHFLRALHLRKGFIELPDDFRITTAPKYRLRGHQLGYRPKTNSYDAWSVPMWEQYIRDLAVFGTNAVELIPPRSDDAAHSPHFPLPQMEMMVEMSRILKEYGLDVWIWYPAMDKDYSDPKTVESALKEWGEVFKRLPRIDAIFVPGGDPGHTQPKYLMALLERETEVLHRYHPKAQMWVSPQSFNQEWLNEFYEILKNRQPAWLTGVVFGPQVRVSLPQLRAAIPARYPIRHYPDITHSRQSQYPVPDWDVAYAITEGREVINPRPMGQAQIFRVLQPYTIGFLTYSEGCNDDVNKFVWSALGWNPDAKVLDILRDYSRYFIGDRYGDDFAQALLALERNWQGPLLTNENVYATLQQFQSMERGAEPQDLQNWRFQQALYRAYYDAYTRSRLLYETDLESRAMYQLRLARSTGSLVAMDKAERLLDRAVDRVSQDWRSRVFELAEALFQSIRMQLSVSRYKAISTDRGATLDTLEVPLNNRLWLKNRFEELRKQPEEADRLRGIDEIVNWTNPGPGGFYDDLGNLTAQSHLVRGVGFEKDPAFLESSLVGFSYRSTARTSWWHHAESLNEAPLKMHYTGLDPSARYKVRVVYTGDNPKIKIRLDAGENIPVHPLLEKPSPVRPVEFDIPPEATKDGDLNLTWRRESGLGGNGRGCQVDEVWLMKK